MRNIAVVTTSRADYGHLLPLLRLIDNDPDLALRLIVSGTHLAETHGRTITEIESDGFAIAHRIPILSESDSPVAIAAAMGRAVTGFGEVFAGNRPDILVVTGDRFEMHAAALAALPFTIPVAHISGGDVTEGAIDDALRHSMTKLSHLHFVSTEESAQRVLQMGEEPWRVFNCGELSLDNLATLQLLSREELESEFNVRLPHPFLLVTYHPVTLEFEQSEYQITQLLGAIESSGRAAVFTMPNADTANRVIGDAIRDFTAHNPKTCYVDNFGMQAYFSVMALATAMVGNSSSGIFEAASFKLPVVNIGTRQDGRPRPGNVIDCGYSLEEILAGIRKAVSGEFRSSLANLVNPYGCGNASAKIAHQLKTVPIRHELIRKRFVNRTPAGS